MWRGCSRGKRRAWHPDRPRGSCGRGSRGVLLMRGAGRGWWLWAAAVALAAAGFTALAIGASQRQGRLLSYPTFDDVYYFAEAVRWMDLRERAGWWGLATDIYQRPPHAPLSIAGAFAVFSVGGVREWTPYALNGVVVLALL